MRMLCLLLKINLEFRLSRRAVAKPCTALTGVVLSLNRRKTAGVSHPSCSKIMRGRNASSTKSELAAVSNNICTLPVATVTSVMVALPSGIHLRETLSR